MSIGDIRWYCGICNTELSETYPDYEISFYFENIQLLHLHLVGDHFLGCDICCIDDLDIVEFGEHLLKHGKPILGRRWHAIPRKLSASGA